MCAIRGPAHLVERLYRDTGEVAGHIRAAYGVTYSHSGRIKLILLPAYAPHLNAIERLWGVLHCEVTHYKFYESFDLFARAIDDVFRRRLPRWWRSWRDTITDNFRIVSYQEFRVLE